MKAVQKSILIIGINFFPEPTGIGKYTSEFAFALAQRKYKVDVVTSYPYYPQWKIAEGYTNFGWQKEEIQGVQVTRCPLYVPGSLSGFKRMLQDFSFFLSSLMSVLGKVVTGKRYELVFVASPSFLSGFVGLFYSFFYRRCKMVYHVQDLQIDAAEELGMLHSKWLIKLLKKSEAIILAGSDWVTTISSGMLQRISAKPVKIRHQYLFPNWVDFNCIYKKAPNLDLLQTLGFPLHKKLCLYSGAVGEKQGLELILDVAKMASSECGDLVFVISGSGPYTKVLRQKSLELGLLNLYFIDLQPLNVFNELLNYAFVHMVIQKEKASDLLLPSKLTNILAVEGLSVITASPGTSLYHIVYDHQVGIVTPPDNAVAFWMALKELYEAPAKARELQKNAGQYALRYLDKNAIIDGFLAETGLA